MTVFMLKGGFSTLKILATVKQICRFTGENRRFSTLKILATVKLMQMNY